MIDLEDGDDADSWRIPGRPRTDMTVIPERSAGVIPFRCVASNDVEYLVLHSALVRNPRAKWEFPKGTVEEGETTLETAIREFIEETSISNFRLLEGFERTLSYSYLRRGRKVLKTVTYYAIEVLDDSNITCSIEHVKDIFGFWYYWGTYNQVQRLLYHAKIRQVFIEAHAHIINEREREPNHGLSQA